MSKIVNQDWKDARMKEHAHYLAHKTPIPPITTSFNKAAQWYIKYLDSWNTKFKVINLGAGVKKIIILDNVCPHCKGKGTI